MTRLLLASPATDEVVVFLLGFLAFFFPSYYLKFGHRSIEMPS